MYSIYHFFAHLLRNKSRLASVGKLEDFPFDREMLSSVNRSKFPDLSIRLNPERSLFSGGELIELKDSTSYNISSFNSTIPTGKKDIGKLVVGKHNSIRIQMEQTGENVLSLLRRDVFYLVGGRKAKHRKICLVHGDFFETINVNDLIQKAFSQVLDDAFGDSEAPVSGEMRNLLLQLFSQQEAFSKVRHVHRASVKLRFRIMTEVAPEGNIFDANYYPEIVDDTLNLMLPLHHENDEAEITRRAEIGLADFYPQVKTIKIKHPFNGWFIVFQANLRD